MLRSRPSSVDGDLHDLAGGAIAVGRGHDTPVVDVHRTVVVGEPRGEGQASGAKRGAVAVRGHLDDRAGGVWPEHAVGLELGGVEVPCVVESAALYAGE